MTIHGIRNHCKYKKRVRSTNNGLLVLKKMVLSGRESEWHNNEYVGRF